MRLVKRSATWLVAALTVATLMGAPAALASGGSSTSTGGGTGGSGGGSATGTCGGLTLSMSGYVPQPWLPSTAYTALATGRTSNCDTVASVVAIKFEDVTSPSDSCMLQPWYFQQGMFSQYGFSTIGKYGNQQIFMPHADCTGHTRTIRATLYRTDTGAVIQSVTGIWDPWSVTSTITG